MKNPVKFIIWGHVREERELRLFCQIQFLQNVQFIFKVKAYKDILKIFYKKKINTDELSLL